jgi:hypothetical protein
VDEPLLLTKLVHWLVSSSGYLLAHSEIKKKRGILKTFSLNCVLKLSLVFRHKKKPARASRLTHIKTTYIIPKYGEVFMKTCERLRKIQWLDDYIESQMNQLQKLESQALKINASPLQADKVQNGNRKKRDDLYVELISTKEEIEEYTAEAMKQKRSFRKQIAEIPDLEARGLLQMVYIDRLSIDEICERKGWTTRKTYYVWLRRAEAFLED